MKEIWELIASGFENRANFPNCIGAVDGIHIRIICPLNSGSMYFNYKGYNSISWRLQIPNIDLCTLTLEVTVKTAIRQCLKGLVCESQ